MQVIEGILLEPVGCLAEFPAGPFHEIAVRLFGRKGKASKSASRSYWHLLNLIEAAGKPLDSEQKSIVQALEIDAAARASVYEDVLPALGELKVMGIQLLIASSLSRAAVGRFLEQRSLAGFFSGVWNRDSASGIKTFPLLRAVSESGLQPKNTIFLTDSAEGLKVARSAGVNPILMMNDPDEAMRLAAHDPAGGIVSMHELPDFVRLVKAQNQQRS